MSYCNPASKAVIGGHPIHPMLVPFSIVCFVGAFVTDLAYWSTLSVMWETFSVWLLTAGLITGALAALAGLIDFFGNRRIRALKPAWPHALGNTLALILSLFNAFKHSRDGYTAVVPTGLILSGLVVVILLVTGWLGGTMVYRHRVGDLSSVRDGGFYGWPYSYYGQHLDPRVEPQRPDLVARAIVPDDALSSHVAPLGLVFSTVTGLPDSYRDGAFVGEHGSWDRSPLNGDKVVFVPFADGKPSGPPRDVVTGFLSPDDLARGRPVGLALDRIGALLIADDLGNSIWRVTSATP